MEEDETPLKDSIVINYTLSEGDVVLVQEWGYGFLRQDIGKYVEVVEFIPNQYLGQGAVTFKAYDSILETAIKDGAYAGVESFGEVPMILLNTNDEFEAPAATEELVELLSIEGEYTGSSSNYYKVYVKHPTTLPDPYEAECNDIIESLNMTFAEGNAFKAIWRKAKARQGVKKKGYDNGVYDSEKVVFFGERMLIEARDNE